MKQSSEARVVLGVEQGDGLAELLAAQAAELPVLFLTAAVTVGDDGRAPASPVLAALRVAVERVSGKKCPRCWNVRVVGGDARHPDLCARCVTVVA